MKIVNEAYAVLSSPEKRREYDTLKHQFGSNAYSRFRNNYSQQDIFSGSDINHVFEEMAKAFGFRSFDDIFTEFYGKEYRSFEFKRPGMFAGGFVFTGPLRRGKYDQSQLPPLTGKLGKLSRYVIEKISGVEFPENGADINDIIRLTPLQAQEGGPYAYFLKKSPKNWSSKYLRGSGTVRESGWREWVKMPKAGNARRPLSESSNQKISH